MTDKKPKLSRREKEAINTNTCYKKVFAGKDGEVVLADLMKAGGCFGTTFVPNDPYSSAYNEGARSMILRILDTVDIDPEKFRKMFDNSNGGYDD